MTPYSVGIDREGGSEKRLSQEAIEWYRLEEGEARGPIKLEVVSPLVSEDYDYSNATLSLIEQRQLHKHGNEPAIKEEGGGSATTGSAYDIKHKIEYLFTSCSGELFEPGYRSSLEDALSQKVILFGERAIAEVARLVKQGSLNVETRAEAIRALGRIYYGAFKRNIFVVLVEALNSPEPVIRESAALALADADDKGAIDFLCARIKVERYGSLRADYEQIIEDLRM